MMALGAVLFGLAAQADINEPFGAPTVVVHEGPWWVNTWRGLQSEIQSEKLTIARCRVEPDSCASPAALRFIAIVDGARRHDDLVRIKYINRAVNLSIRPLPTAERRIDLSWTSPLAALASGVGDCKQYSTLKYAMLSELGVAPDDLRIIIVFIKSARENHAVLAVRNAGRWLILDNRSLELIDSSQLHDYLPLYALDYRGVGKFVPPSSPKIASSPCGGIIG